MSYMQAMTQIAQSVLTGSAASIDFSSIPGTYNSLLLVWQARCDASSLQDLWVRFNNDSGANYDWQGGDYNASGAGGGQAGAATEKCARGLRLLSRRGRALPQARPPMRRASFDRPGPLWYAKTPSARQGTPPASLREGTASPSAEGPCTAWPGAMPRNAM